MDIVESARDIVGQLLDITPADVLSAIIERAEVSRALLSSIVENFDLEDIAENLREILANLDWDLDVHGAVDIILRQFQLDEIMQLLGKFVDELSEGAYSIVDFLDDVMWKFGIVAMFDYLEDIMTRLSIGADELINMLIDSFGVDIILQYLAEIYSRLGLEDVTDLESLFAQYSLYEIISMLGQLMSDLHMTSIQMLLALLEYYSLTDIINYASEIAGALAGISMGDILAAIIEKFEVTGTELAIIIQKFDLEAIAENLKELITELAGELNASEVLDTIMMYTTLAEIVGVLDIIVEELQEISYGIEEFFSEIIWKYSLADVVSYLNNMVNVLKISAEEAFRMILKRFGELMIFSNIEYIVSNFSVDALKAFKVILEECVIDVVVDNLVDLAGALKLSATQILSAFLDVRTIEEIISCADDIVDKLTGLTPGDLLSAIIERVTITEEILLDIVQNFDLADIVENLKEILTKLADSIGIDDALDIIMQQFGLAGIVEFLGDIISELNEISYSIDEFIADMLTRFGLNAAIAYLQEIAAALNISPLEIFNRIIEIFSLDTILGKLGDIFRELTGMNKADALVSIISSAQSLSLTMVTTILNNFDLDAVVARYTGCFARSTETI
ncbi:MAG TPA: CBS domain-containing protein [Clostridiaceae bacterium]|nr:CBS domain-containing protein [Clostridiaceae bacterium]